MAVSMLARNEKIVLPAVEIPGQMPEAQHIIIETKNLSVFYGEKAAIQNVSLAFPEHQVTALIGPSGCGKSTFLRSLNRMNDEIAGCRMSGGIFIKESTSPFRARTFLKSGSISAWCSSARIRSQNRFLKMSRSVRSTMA